MSTRESDFILACKKGTAEQVMKLLTPKLLTAADETGNLPLHILASRGAIDIVKILLENQPRMLVLQQNRAHAIPLHYAAKNGHLETVNLLLQYRPEQQVLIADDGGSIPLHLSARMGHAEVVRSLLQYQPTIQVMTTDKQTSWRPRLPLHFACERGYVEIADQLLLHEPARQVLHDGGMDYKASVLFTLVEARSRIESSARIAAAVLSFETERQLSTPMRGLLWNLWRDSDHWFNTLVALFRECVIQESDLPQLASDKTIEKLRDAVADMHKPKSARSVYVASE